MIFMVIVRQTVSVEDMDPDDFWENPSGSYMIDAHTSEEALDKFHFTIPIACLDDFDISVHRYNGPLPRGVHQSDNHI